MMRVRIRRVLMTAAALAMMIGGIGPAVEAANPCYPAKCKGADARLGSISAPNPMYMQQTSFVRLNGRNVGTKASDVVARLAFSRGDTEPHLRRRVHVGKGQPFSVYFRATPRSSGRARLRACVEAKPQDVNPSNDCGSTRIRVRRLG